MHQKFMHLFIVHIYKVNELKDSHTHTEKNKHVRKSFQMTERMSKASERVRSAAFPKT